MALKLKSLEQALIRYLATLGIPATEIIDLQDECYDEVGCPTCGYDKVYEISIWYLNGIDKYSHYYTYSGSFSELINELTDESEVA